MSKINETGTCALCGGPYTHWGNNPQPVLPKYEQRVCDDCNGIVIARRIHDMSRHAAAKHDADD